MDKNWRGNATPTQISKRKEREEFE